MGCANPRLEALRQRLLSAPHEICAERARYLTESYRLTENEPQPIRFAKALRHILANISVIIRDDELIVGCRTSKLKGAPLYPENKSSWIEENLESFTERDFQRVAITEREKQELRDEILPYWRGKTVEDRMNELMPDDLKAEMNKMVFTMMMEITYGIGHFTTNTQRVLARGLEAVMEEAKNRESKNHGDESNAQFYRACRIVCEAAIAFAYRYADEAKRLAKLSADPARRRELEEIAAVCERVPAKPARTFHEAVQSLYFLQLIAQIESGGNSISVGRIDKILYPFYKHDVEAGTIDAAHAQMLVECMFLKMGEIWNVLEETYLPGGEGPEGKTTQNVIVGGMKPDGSDDSNELTHLLLEAYADLRTVQPNFGIRINRNTPDDILLRACELSRDGVLIHFFNDEVIVPALVKKGCSVEDARDYSAVGCVEPNAHGKTFGSTFAIQFNAAKCLEFALNNGMCTLFGLPNGLPCGSLSTYDSYGELFKAYQRQVSYFVRRMADAMAILDSAIAERVPSPFASSLIDGCLEKGLDVTRGGAKYNSTGVQLMGLANVADSLAAVKKLVFDEQAVEAGLLAQALTNDFSGHEPLRQMVLKRAPKYGNDDEYVDEIARAVVKHFADELGEYRTYRGGQFLLGVFSVAFHIAMGAFTGTTPDGRKMSEVLANGITPQTGLAGLGPTAIARSAARLGQTEITNGNTLILRFHPKSLQPEKLGSLIRTYFELGGMQLQFNMVDTQTLLDAQASPEKYRDLVVRIAGYSVLFTNLSKKAQDEIISRTACSL
ncbi:MAG: formate C-acetyltransferase/glycerol dehydratase family glycyl radical enzyme [Candidatus Abyssobacteria bacterium SURF_17]|uniref:Formate C-acetyltransferase/glycerol dehydratase family glycyl radical enzyme n=1 Tax=Candidatus Abyssobacteria bacterium SURF_17 TaxID=2093361 RepID=A0A419ETX8_9BACT|nr:MAG: formate C-acetyltransferase/glycerol dehydratase family glycyl radical enzyme [Candidatus Abyssubacteria bacterium SURF_17]